MKGQITKVQPLSLRTIYTPLHDSFSVIVDGGGSLTQFYYTNANQYIPNRATTPMKLRAKLFITDPDGVIPSGDKSSALTVTWYENTENTPITSSITGYTVNADGSLSFSEVKGATAQKLSDASIDFTTDTKYGDYELDVNGLPETVNTVYGVVISTKEGDNYGLRHLENIWKKKELAWKC